MDNRQTNIRQRLSRLKNRVFSLDLQNIYQLDDPLGDERGSASPTNITFKVYDTDEVLKVISRVNPFSEQGRRFALKRLLSGDKAVVGYHQDVPVFYGWLMFEEIEMTYGRFMSAPEGTAFSYNLFTATSHRRRGIMTQFYNFVGRFLNKRDFQTLYVGIATKNRISIRAHRKSGFKEVGYFYTMKIFSICFTFARFVVGKRFFIMCG